MAMNRTLLLNTGATIPAIGFGTWQAAPKEVESAVEIALRAGYRHIDCAAIYRNESEVGRGIKKSGVSRSDIFLTSKLWNTMHNPNDVEDALDKTLEDLGTDYLDLYLIHWPVAFKRQDNRWFPLDERGVFQLADISFIDTYKAMEALIQTGKVRGIGVSNFNVRRLKELLAHCDVVPAVNQIERHPYLQQHEVVEFCQQRQILVEAYSPLGNNTSGLPRTVDDAEVHSVARSLSLDPGQALINWAVQAGTVPLPKSVTKSRIQSNFRDVVLSEEAIRRLDALERHRRFNFPGRWGADIFDEVGQAGATRMALESAPENLRNFTL